MLTKLIVLPAIAIVCGLVGIGYLLVPVTHTVSWYLANPAVTQAQSAICRNTGEFSANCRNAEEAKWHLDTQAVIGHR